MYDCIIIGAGVNGAFIARELSKYDLKILVIEKESDVCAATSGANSAIIHSGYDPEPHTLKAKLNVLGNKTYDQVASELDVSFQRIGSLTIATSDEQIKALEQLKIRAKENNVEVEILDKEEIQRIEPFITNDAKQALLAKSTGIINPFELVVALMENAIDNNVLLNLDEEVINILKEDKSYKVVTNKSEYKTRIVINAAGLYADKINNFINDEKGEILPRKGEYLVLDHFQGNYINHVLFTIPSNIGKGTLITPTTHGNYLIGPSSYFIDDKENLSTNKEGLDYIKENARKLVKEIPINQMIRQFSGLRAYHKSDDFVINEKDGFVNVLGMQSPGLASAPAAAEYVIKMISNIIDLKPNSSYNPKRRPLVRLNFLTIEDRKSLIKDNKTFGNIVCRCEGISEGEVVDSIKRSCGAKTVKGVKIRVRPGFGKCQGGFCEPLIIKILARELNKDIKDIKYDNPRSYILHSETKDGVSYD